MTAAPPIRTATRVLATMAVMGMCAVVWHNLPAGSDVYAPFPVSGVVGEPARGRGIVATVTGIQIAPQLIIESAGGGERFSAVGQWVVVQTSLQSGDRPEVAHADLTVGSRVYLPTGRLPSGSTLGGDIEPGFVSNGAWIFDVAPEPLGTEPVTLRTWVGDGRLDSRLDIALDLRETVIPRTDLATASLIQVRTA